MQMVKRLPAVQEIQVQSLGWEDHLEKGMATHSGFLPGESHGQRSLAGYSPWSPKKSDMTEPLTLLIFQEGLPWWLSGKEPANAGNAGSILGLGRSLEKEVATYSCLRNSMDRGG